MCVVLCMVSDVMVCVCCVGVCVLYVCVCVLRWCVWCVCVSVWNEMMVSPWLVSNAYPG